MKEKLAAKVQKVVARQAPPPAADGFMERVHQAITTVQDTIPETGACPADDVAVTVVMSLLGPSAHEAGPPPEPQQLELLGLLHCCGPDRLLDEIATAYGCGFGRSCLSGRGRSWRHVWPNAVNALTRRAVRPAVDRVHGWLAQQRIPNYPEKRRSIHLESDACRLAAMIVTPTAEIHCPHAEAGQCLAALDGGIEVRLETKEGYSERVPAGSRFLFTPASALCPWLGDEWDNETEADARVTMLARDDDARIYPGGQRYHTLPAGEAVPFAGPVTIQVWHCTCGWKQCEQQHRVTNWNPGRSSLWNFTANAVCGPNAELQTGSLMRGMYLPLLIHEGW